MGVATDESGRRWVQVETEVPGAPEEVWKAISTGQGISSWFVPTDVEEDQDGRPARMVAHFGPGMDSFAEVTAWEPPSRFAADSRDLGPDAPKLGSEWTVEARPGGVCLVRVVHSLSATNNAWDEQLRGAESGWPDFFRILRLYLTHYRGQRCSTIQMMGTAPEPASAAWDVLTGALGLTGAAAGERRKAPEGVPPLAGLVELAGQGEHSHQLLLRLDEPAPGTAHLFALPMGGQVYPVIRLYLYGDQAAAAAERDEPLWRAWMNECFPTDSG